MNRYSLRHLSKQNLDRGLRAIAASDRQTTADLLAHLGEAEAQKVFSDHGYSAMLTYCMGELLYSEDTALRRIGVARTARRFPQIFPAIAAGRLNLTAVLLIKPHLRPENAAELLAAIAGKTKREIQKLIAERWPESLALERVGKMKVVPIAPGLYELRVVVRQATLDGLNRVRDLMSHSNPSGNMDVVLDRLARFGIAKHEKQKFGATDRPHAARPATADSRHIPAAIRRAVYARDGGQCIFVSAKGKRCESRHQLEYDHIVPVAKGGKTTMSNLRLLCRPHNQFAAIDIFGLAFMGSNVEQAIAMRVPMKPSEFLNADPTELAPERVAELAPELIANGSEGTAGVPTASPRPHDVEPECTTVWQRARARSTCVETPYRIISTFFTAERSSVCRRMK